MLTIFLIALACHVQGSAQQPSDRRVPVLVELFTSEGCSDCPPADTLLARLDAAQFVPGAYAIVLSEHVTYWNHLGWRDPFSFDAMTERQEQYVRQFGLDSSYTPQMVVDGAVQFVGSDERTMVRAIAHSAENPKQSLVIENARWNRGVAEFSVHGTATPNARLLAVLAADATHSEVLRGENAGRMLHHIAVVRVMKDFGDKVADDRPMTLPGGPFALKNETDSPVRLVVFEVDHKTGHVLAVAERTLRN